MRQQESHCATGCANIRAKQRNAAVAIKPKVTCPPPIPLHPLALHGRLLTMFGMPAWRDGEPGRRGILHMRLKKQNHVCACVCVYVCVVCVCVVCCVLCACVCMHACICVCVWGGVFVKPQKGACASLLPRWHHGTRPLRVCGSRDGRCC